MGRQFQKGNPGKPKGAVCRFTTLKNAFLEAFDKTGGIDGLVAWINASQGNRGDFYRLVARMLPADVNVAGKDGGAIRGELVVKVIKVGAQAKPGNGNGNGDNGNGNGSK